MSRGKRYQSSGNEYLSYARDAAIDIMRSYGRCVTLPASGDSAQGKAFATKAHETSCGSWDTVVFCGLKSDVTDIVGGD